MQNGIKASPLSSSPLRSLQPEPDLGQMEGITDISEAVAVALGSRITAVSVPSTTLLSIPMSKSITLRHSRKPRSILQYNYGKPPTYDSVPKALILSPAIFIPQVSMLALLVSPSVLLHSWRWRQFLNLSRSDGRRSLGIRLADTPRL